MATLHETAYPRLKPDPTAKELAEIYTPTEAGAVAIGYSLILGLCYREMTFSGFLTGLKDTVITTASIMVIVGGASAFAWILTRERIPQALTAFIVIA